MVKLFFGKQYKILLYILVIFILGATNNIDNDCISNNNDTILKKEFEKEINRQIKLLGDTNYLKIFFLDGEIEFYKDTFFSQQKKHIIVRFKFSKEWIIDTYFQVYKTDGKKIIKCIDEKKMCCYNYFIYDYNFDKTNDFSIKWAYCAGKCNGTIFSVYLYNKELDMFYYKKELDYNTGLYIDTLNLSIVSEDRCEVISKKYLWNKFDLILTEQISFDNEFAFYLGDSDECIRNHYFIENNKIVLKETKQTCELPKDWYSFRLK